MLEILNIANEYKNLTNFTMKHHMLYVWSIKIFQGEQKVCCRAIDFGT
jgi:hypothetical protein